MGCAASTGGAGVLPEPTESRGVQQSDFSAAKARAPEGKPVEDWDAEEVSGWFSTLVQDVQKYRSTLLPEEGCFVVEWTEEYLVGKGVTAVDAKRLIVYRNKARSRSANNAAAPGGAAATASTASSTAVGLCGISSGEEMGVPAVLGDGPTTSQSAAGDAASGGGGGKSLTALAAKGVRVARRAIEALAPSLPFPGDKAAALVMVLLDLVDSAIANHANLAELQQRAVAFLDILAAYHKSLAELQYKRAVDDFAGLLEGITAYTRAYCGRNCLMRLLTSGSDQEHYEELLAKLAALGEQVMALLAVDSNARLQQLQDAVELLQRSAQYQDPAAGARELVKELGGLDEVLSDGDKLRRVMQTLDVGARLTIEAVTSLLASHLDKGPQRHIRQPDLRLFWKNQYAGQAEVPWYEFWDSFPALLIDNPADKEMVDELGRMVADEAAQQAFMRAVERSNKDSVSVYELKRAFVGEEGLVEQVSRLLSKLLDGVTGLENQEVASGGKQQQRTATLQQVSRAAAVVGRCQLPALPAHYTGREKEAVVVVDQLVTRGSLLLLAPGGFGKSSLATDVGWRLVREGKVPGGALWVDLREADSIVEIEARFCSALGLQLEPKDNVGRILTAAKMLVTPATSVGSGGTAAIAALLVVDNAEDALLQEAAAQATRTLLSKLLQEVPAVRLLVTSRASLETAGGTIPGAGLSNLLSEHHVGAISPGEAAGLVQSVASDLTESESAKVAAACCCVPLVLCMVSNALVAGQLMLEGLSKLTSTITDGGNTSSTVGLVLASLRQNEQQAAAQLAVFSSAFDIEAAVAVLAKSEPQVHGLMAVLCCHSVLQRSSHQTFTMHMVVRQQAAELGQAQDPSLRMQAEGRFVTHMLDLLVEWGNMYHTAAEWRLALAMARDHQPDIGKLLELLSLGPSGGISGTSWGPALVSAALTNNVCNLMVALGILQRWRQPCMQLLKLLEPPAASSQQEIAGSGEVVQLPAASLLFLLSKLDFHTKDGELYARRSWDSRRQYLGEEHPDTMSSIYNLAVCFSIQGHHSAAEPLFRQVLELRKRVLGEEHPDTISSSNGLANCISNQGHRSAAEPLFRQALELWKRVLGEEHPASISSISNLASCISNQGHHSAAEPLFRQTLELRRRVLGEEHPATISSINNLASCISNQGHHSAAEPLYCQALELRRRVLGQEHPDTITSIDNMATSISGQGHHSIAEPLFRQALELRRRVLGEEHPDTFSSISNLASCLNTQGQYSAAEPLCCQALELLKRLLGEEHPDTITSIDNMATCINGQGHHSAAELLFRQALELRRQVLGEEHPDTISSISNLASCLNTQGQYSAAEPLYHQAVELFKRLLGEEHPDTITSINNLAGCIKAQAK